MICHWQKVKNLTEILWHRVNQPEIKLVGKKKKFCLQDHLQWLLKQNLGSLRVSIFSSWEKSKLIVTWYKTGLFFNPVLPTCFCCFQYNMQSSIYCLNPQNSDNKAKRAWRFLWSISFYQLPVKASFLCISLFLKLFLACNNLLLTSNRFVQISP